MVNLNDRIYGLSLLSWILIIIVLIFFFVQNFSSTPTPTPTLKLTKSEKFTNDNIDLNENFENSQKNSKNVKVYNFNTSWCGWSVRFQPEWKKFEDAVRSDAALKNVETFDVKCDDSKNEALCKEFEVSGFPTVIIEAKGQRGLYKGARDAKEIADTVKDL
jgi:thiol-disulfide isomerase/thioredoxin